MVWIWYEKCPSNLKIIFTLFDSNSFWFWNYFFRYANSRLFDDIFHISFLHLRLLLTYFFFLSGNLKNMTFLKGNIAMIRLLLPGCPLYWESVQIVGSITRVISIYLAITFYLCRFAIAYESWFDLPIVEKNQSPKKRKKGKEKVYYSQ